MLVGFSIAFRPSMSECVDFILFTFLPVSRCCQFAGVSSWSEIDFVSSVSAVYWLKLRNVVREWWRFTHIVSVAIGMGCEGSWVSRHVAKGDAGLRRVWRLVVARVVLDGSMLVRKVSVIVGYASSWLSVS